MKDIPKEIISAAQATERSRGIPASVTLAQWALESAWGKAVSGKWNYGGITAKTKGAVFPTNPGTATEPATLCWTHEVYKGERVKCQRWFKDFDSPQAYFEAHAKLLATGKPYARARTLLPNPDAFADALTGVYATDPNYGTTLKGIMRINNLYQYNMGTVPVQIPPAIHPVDDTAITAALNKAEALRTVPVAIAALDLPRSTVTEVLKVAPAGIIEHATVATKLKLGERSTWIGGAIVIASMAADPTVQAAARPVWSAIQHGSWGGILSAAIGLGLVISKSRSTPRTDAVLAATRIANALPPEHQIGSDSPSSG